MGVIDTFFSIIFIDTNWRKMYITTIFYRNARIKSNDELKPGLTDTSHMSMFVTRQPHRSSEDRAADAISIVTGVAFALWCFLLLASLRDQDLIVPTAALLCVRMCILSSANTEMVNTAMLLDLAVLFVLCMLFFSYDESDAFCCVVSHILSTPIFTNAYPSESPETVEACDQCTP